MSSKNKTPLGFSQWEGTDIPQRLDFNGDNLLVDTILQMKADLVDGKISPMPTPADVGAVPADHLTDEAAHPNYFRSISDLDSRMKVLELIYATNVKGNPYSIKFDAVDNLLVSGVWNQSLARLEF